MSGTESVEDTTLLQGTSSSTASIEGTTPLLQGTSSSTASSRYHNATFEDLIKYAIEDYLEENIELQSYSRTERGIASFCNLMSILVLNREENPTAVGRTVVDMYTKEYKNYGVPDAKNPGQGDITQTLVHKTTPSATGRKYQFTSNQGIVWSIPENLALQILAKGISTSGNGGTMELQGNYRSNMTSLSVVRSEVGSESSALSIAYNQEERIVIPVGKKVLVAFTTYFIEYHLRYKLEFRVPKMHTIPVKYKDFKPICTCLPERRTAVVTEVYYKTVVHNLPEYREDSQYAYFTQEGVLSWLGESYEVTKTEAPLL